MKPKKKTFLGAPMNWDRKNMWKPNWDKTDDRIFPPKAWGIGWTVNFYALLKKLNLIKK